MFQRIGEGKNTSIPYWLRNKVLGRKSRAKLRKPHAGYGRRLLEPVHSVQGNIRMQDCGAGMAAHAERWQAVEAAAAKARSDGQAIEARLAAAQ